MTLAAARTRRVLALLVTTGAVVALAPVAYATGTGTASTGTASTVAACPKKSGSLSFKSSLTNGVTMLGKNATITGSTANACGLLAPVNGKERATIPAKNIQFAPVTTKTNGLSFPTTLKATSALTGPVAYTTTGQTATFTGSVLATANIQGQMCSIPLKVVLTTGKSGALTGKPFNFDKKGVSRGKLVANNFAVPAIAASDTCNILVAMLSNTLIGLPLTAGESSITYDGSLQLT